MAPTPTHPHSQSHRTSFFVETKRRRRGRQLGFSKPSPWLPPSSSNRPDPRGHPLPPAPATILHYFVDSKVRQPQLFIPNPGRAARSSGGASFKQVYSSPIWYHFAGKIDLPCPSNVDLTLILRSSSTAQVKI